MMSSISIVVPTYNRSAALDCVLSALSKQFMCPNEVVVADDGSVADTRAIVEKWQEKMPCKLLHVWQEDIGFRLARSRNRAVAASTSDYIVFLDGDCIPFPDFVSRHLDLAEHGCFVAGNRILLDRNLTQDVEFGHEPILAWGAWRWMSSRISHHVNRLLPLLRLPDGGWRKKVAPNRWQGARGCNLGIWRDDYIAVNGCDESFEGWGHDDAELVSRLFRCGVLRKEGRFSVPVLHLWHRENDRSLEDENRRRLYDVIEGRRPTYAVLGVDQYL